MLMPWTTHPLPEYFHSFLLWHCVCQIPTMTAYLSYSSYKVEIYVASQAQRFQPIVVGYCCFKLMGGAAVHHGESTQ